MKSPQITGAQPVSVSALEIAPELGRVQALMPIALEDRERLKADIQANGIRDALKGYRHSANGKTTFRILAGATRYAIALELGFTTVPFEFVDVAPKERENFAITENLARRHLDTTQKRELVRFYLERNPGLSDRQIGKQAGVSKNTAAAVRSTLERRGQIDHVAKRQDTLGRRQPLKGKSAGKKQKPTTQKKAPAISPAQKTRGVKLAKDIRAIDKQLEKLQAERNRKFSSLVKIGPPRIFGL
jgi:ParB-like chromosome segregation protein Spo0J